MLKRMQDLSSPKRISRLIRFLGPFSTKANQYTWVVHLNLQKRRSGNGSLKGAPSCIPLRRLYDMYISSNIELAWKPANGNRAPPEFAAL